MLTVLAPAKINLFLEILKPRGDTYHEVDMVMQTVSLCDLVRLRRCEKPGVQLFGDSFGPVEENTCVKAARVFFEVTGLFSGLEIFLEKKIPVAAGLAGGSSDAAAVLVGLNKLFSTGLSKEKLGTLGAKIGADVPFCVLGGAARSIGIGTELSQMQGLPRCHIVLAKPEISVSTAQAYAKSDEFTGNPVSPEKLIKALKNQDLPGICAHLYNKFETVLAIPEVENLKTEMRNSKALGTSMSGSGSCVFGIFQDKILAESCIKKLREKYKEVFLCKPLVHGALPEE